MCVQVDQELGDRLMAAVQADPQLEFVVDVEKLRLEVPALDIDVASDLAHPLLREVLPSWLPTIPVNPFTQPSR